ncbi:ABC transporter permease [Nonomuraea endophytica]|nr:ABC transporter permease [Nonomuraea endophytica]
MHTAWRGRHPWIVFAARRFARLVVLLSILVTASFGLMHLVPGDPVRAALGPEATAAQVAQRTSELGLDRPLPDQFLDYLSGLPAGDLGTSLVSGQRVGDIVVAGLPNTLTLAGLAFLVVVAVAVPVGLLAAIHTRGDRHRRGALAFTSGTGLLAVVPEFVLAAGLVATFAVGLRLVPVAGAGGPDSYVLPVLSLAAAPAAMLARIVRAEALRELGQDYVRTARAKRLPARLLYVRHVLPNALTSALTICGMLIPGLVMGTVLVEKVFAWPGLGSAITESVLQKDYPVAQAMVLLLGALVLTSNLVVDLVLARLDPRPALTEA